MIPKKIQALFDFIDYLDGNKKEYVEKYLPLCEELIKLDTQRHKLKPKQNYNDKQEYDKIKEIIATKFSPITAKIYNPITAKLRELNIWTGDDTFNSIWNSNSAAIIDFKENFKQEDIPVVMKYKNKYLSFRNDTNTDFLCLSFAFHVLDETFKELFDFFKDSDKNEFDSFETKTIEVDSIEEALHGFLKDKKKNIKFSIPTENILAKPTDKPTKNEVTNIKNELYMGNKYEVGDIKNNNGQVIIGDANETKMNSTITDKGIDNNEKSDLPQKTFKWQRTGIIIATILAITTIILMIIFNSL
ncbi:hypothetical protein [Labilibaculum euxinus]